VPAPPQQLEALAYAALGVAGKQGELRTLVAFPLYFGEFLVVLWLAFVGAKPRAA